MQFLARHGEAWQGAAGRGRVWRGLAGFGKARAQCAHSEEIEHEKAILWWTPDGN